jgi:hypothetical protein
MLAHANHSFQCKHDVIERIATRRDYVDSHNNVQVATHHPTHQAIGVSAAENGSKLTH